MRAGDSVGHAGAPALRIAMLGALVIRRADVALVLPASRKVRGLLAWLALAPRAVSRSRLCELLWDLPGDPRSELRWCLSKIRGLLDAPASQRVQSRDDAVRLDLGDCEVDAIEVSRAAQQGVAALTRERQRELAALFRGDFMEGLSIDASPSFDAWLTAQRRRFRRLRVALLEPLVCDASDDEAFQYLATWLELAPFDARAHALLLERLARCGRIRDGDEHLAATVRRFQAEGLDCRPIRDAWLSARARGRCAAPPDPGPIADLDADGVRVAPAAHRASIAVMPLADRSVAAAGPSVVAEALTHDVITRLAKLRTLFVIAQGTVFALRDRHLGDEEAGRLLDVDYVVGGWVLRRGDRLSASVELAEARSSRIVWAEIFDEKFDDALLVLEEMGNRIVASVAGEIEAIERNRAVLKPPNSLDAWEAHHRGLWHMYRFNQADNASARRFFERAVHLDPTFARAWAGLSFTHFQDAFQGWTEREPETERALQAAGQSLMADDRDPAAHWAMGRALWLRGAQDSSEIELERCVDLSPNFALGHYTLAFVHSQAGDPSAAIESADYSRHLSPFDPLLFGMLGARALALVRLERFEEAAEWAVKAAARPNAHAHILAIAAFTLALAGSLEKARAYLAAIRRTRPSYAMCDFLSAFRFDAHGEALFREGGRRIGVC